MTMLQKKITGSEAFNNLSSRGYKRVYHFHIRKTAGTSLNSAFWGLAGLDLKSLGRNPVATQNGYTFIRHNPRAISTGNYFFANSHHPAHQLCIPPGTCTITVIRSPQERLLSLYRYLRWIRDDAEAINHEVYWHAVYQKAAWIGSTFDEFLDHIPRSDLMPQLYMFSENYNIDEALEHVLDCSAILFTDQFSDGISQLKDRLDLPMQEKHERRFGQNLRFQLTSNEQDRLDNLLLDEITFINQLRDCRKSVFKF